MTKTEKDAIKAAMKVIQDMCDEDCDYCPYFWHCFHKPKTWEKYE